jgi:hypothetical protein
MNGNIDVGGEGMSVDRKPGPLAGYESARNAEGSGRAVRGKRTSLAARIALITGSVIFSLMVLEVGLRLLRFGPEGLTHWPNFASSLLSIGKEGQQHCSYTYDATLGWVLPTTCRTPRYNIDADGFRLNTAGSSPAEPPVLATGASFTLGEEVADDESWPAYLQNMTRRKVVNAGVSGYSLDQTVLRTERIAPKVKPLFVVVAFTPGDIRRSEVKMAWSREKPYFDVVDGRLELRNVPVPAQAKTYVPLPLAARLFGRLAVADEIVRRLGIQQGWYFDEIQAVPRGTGETIACLLMTRLAKIGVPVVVVAQYGRSHWTADPEHQARDTRRMQEVLGCADKAGLVSIDLFDPMKRLVDKGGIEGLYRKDHHSAEGNRTVADLIGRELVSRGLLPQTADR